MKRLLLISLFLFLIPFDLQAQVIIYAGQQPQPEVVQVVPTISELPPEAQSTPYDKVREGLKLLPLTENSVLADIGCGYDARVSVLASMLTGCDAVAVEIDHDRAESARRNVKLLGLESKIKVVEGDATAEEIEADFGFVFLWPDTLDKLKSKLCEYDSFVSYMHKVPGLEMQQHGDFWVWKKPAPVQLVDRPYALWNGLKHYKDFNPACNCSMCQSIRSQLIHKTQVETFEVPATDDEGIPVVVDGDVYKWYTSGSTSPWTIPATIQDGQTDSTGRWTFKNNKMYPVGKLTESKQEQRTGHYETWRYCVGKKCYSKTVWVWDN